MGSVFITFFGIRGEVRRVKVVRQGKDTDRGSIRVCPVPRVRGKEVRIYFRGRYCGDTEKGRER